MTDKQDNTSNIDGALNQINEVFSDLAKDALAIALVTQDGKVAYHYSATGHMSYSVEDAAFVIDMIKQLHQANKQA